MADNYLEKRMEDYRSRRTNSVGARRSSLADNSPTIFILSTDRQFIESTIHHLSHRDVRIAFTLNDLTEGRDIAQRTGSQHHPIDPKELNSLQMSLDIITKRWKRLDLAILDPAVSTPQITTFLTSQSILTLFPAV